jgi:hypothetical protein
MKRHYLNHITHLFGLKNVPAAMAVVALKQGLCHHRRHIRGLSVILFLFGIKQIKLGHLLAVIQN